MGQDKTENRICAVCLKNNAVAECDSCMKPLCKKCRSTEILRTSQEEVTVKSFCPQCQDEQKIIQEKGMKVFGLGQVTDMVNHEQGKLNGFKVRIKIN
jgi:hypothetical protein